MHVTGNTLRHRDSLHFLWGETFAVYIFFRPGFFNSDLIRIWIIIWDLSLEKLINRTQTFVRVTLVFEFKGAELKHEMMGKDLHCTNSALQLHNWGHTNVSNALHHSFICGNFFICIFDKGVAICTLYGTLINKLYGTGHLPSKFSPNMFDSKGTDASIFMLGIGTLLIYLWGDFHFYWTHRMLHTQWFYKSVHKIHHESYNPDPFSGKYFNQMYNHLVFSDWKSN